MYNGEILNRALLQAISVMGHRDILMVVEAGFPVPDAGCRVVDLAIKPNLPDIETTIGLITNNMIYEECIVGQEQHDNNRPLYNKIAGVVKSCPVTLVPHDEIMFGYVKKAKVIVRTGAFDPWGNIVLISGVDAPRWFCQEGVIVPDYYKERVERGAKQRCSPLA